MKNIQNFWTPHEFYVNPLIYNISNMDLYSRINTNLNVAPCDKRSKNIEKITPFVDDLKANIQKHRLSRDLVIDYVKFKNKLRNGETKRYRILYLCDDTGYVYNFLIFAGNRTMNENDYLRLLEDFDMKGRHLYIKYSFNSYDLLSKLSTSVAGLFVKITKNKKFLPFVMNEAKFSFFSFGNLICCVYINKRPVYYLSNIVKTHKIIVNGIQIPYIIHRFESKFYHSIKYRQICKKFSRSNKNEKWWKLVFSDLL